VDNPRWSTTEDGIYTVKSGYKKEMAQAGMGNAKGTTLCVETY